MSVYVPYLEIAPGADLTVDPIRYSWSDYTDRIWMPGKITRTWGRGNRFPNASPARLQFVLTNDDGLFVPDNPLSSLYGLIDLNTPARVLMAPVEHTAADAFGRTAASSWGTADTGGAWTNTGTAADYSVASGAGRHTSTAANVSHYSTLPFSIVRTDVKVRIRVNALSTGAQQYAGVTVRYVDANNNQRADIVFAVGGALTVRLVARAAGVETVTTTSSALSFTHSTSAWYWIRLQTGLSTARVRAWQDGTTEPRGWNIDGSTGIMLTTTAGAFGTFSRRETGNTNANATTDFDDFAGTDGPYILQTCYVDEWPAEWSDASGNQALAPITASGRLRQIQNAKSLRSAIFRATYREPTLVAYWPMEDKSAATTFVGLPNLVPTPYSGISLASDSNVVGSEPLPVFSGTSHVFFTVPPYAASTKWSLRFVCKIPTSPATNAQVISWITPASTIVRWQVTLIPGTPDTVRIDGYDSAGVVAYTGAAMNFVDSSSNAELSNGRQLYIQIDASQAGAGIDIDWDVWYIPDDGQYTATSVGQLINVPTTTLTNVNNVYFDGVTGFSTGGVVLGHIAVGSAPFGPDGYGAVGYAGELTADRFDRLCAEESVAAYFGDLLGAGAGSTAQTMGPQAAQGLYAHLQQIESTESGILFDGRQGQVTILPRSQRQDRTVDLTLDISLGHLGWPVRRTLDDQLVVNEVTAARPNGSSETVADDALVAKVGYKPQSVDVNSFKDAELRYHAQWWLSLGTNRQARYPQVPLLLHRNSSLIRDYLEMDIGGRIQVTHLPGELPPDTLELLVEGGTDVIDPFEWRVTINASPGGQWLVGVLDAGKRYDCGACTTAEDLDTTETGIDVAIADNCTWTHADGDYAISIGGERMTVTAVTAPVGAGSSWTQTLTVTRSVNGVVKSHATGAAVHIADPFILTL